MHLYVHIIDHNELYIEQNKNSTEKSEFVKRAILWFQPDAIGPINDLCIFLALPRLIKEDRELAVLFPVPDM